MTTQENSLAKLVENMQTYDENMPVRIPDELRQGVWLSLVANVIGMPLWILLEGHFAIFFVPLNTISLMLILAFMVASKGMTQPVNADTQQLAWIASIPSGINAIGVGVIASLVILVIAVGILLILAFTGILGAMLVAPLLGR